jgi:hypothetical protein
MEFLASNVRNVGVKSHVYYVFTIYRTNIIRHENIVRHIKSKRLSWLGHVERMPDGRVAKSIYKWKPYATRPKGRPRLRWEDDVRNDEEDGSEELETEGAREEAMERNN